MGDKEHLERMGRELKCPICLSLFTSAASLTCNHVFCNDCIVKSMKTDATCPVCKVPYHRRDIRAAPHMDSLVNIYKSMEVASGVNLHVSQNTLSSDKLSGGEKDDRAASKCTRKERDETCQAARKRRVSKGKGSKETNVDASGPIVLKPSSQTKKRVQLPQHPSSQEPAKSTESMRRVETEKALVASNESSSPNKKGKLSLSPFFWLRDEDELENLSQLGESDQQLYLTPPEVPSFSDLKDSDHESPEQVNEQEKTAAMDVFDSEMFEWTQRPCSPEVLPSPVKATVPDSNESDQSQSKRPKVANRRVRNTVARLGSGISKGSSASEGTGYKQAGSCTSNRRNQKSNEDLEAKHAKRSKDQGSGAQTGAGTSEESGKVCLVDGKKGTKRKRSSAKGDPVARSDEVSLGREVLCNGDQIQGLSDAQPGKKTSGNFCMKKRGRKSNAVSLNPDDLSGSLDLSKARKKTSKDKGTKNSLVCSSKIEDAEALVSTENPAKKDSMHSPCLTSKRVRKPNLKAKLRDDSKNEMKSTEDEGNCTVEVTEKSLTNEKPSLRRCEAVANKFPCAFCHSTEVSEVLGELAHYNKGQPVSAGYDGGSEIIHAHKVCAEWAPNVYFKKLTAVNLEAEVTRSRRLSCSCCGLKGAALGCYEKACKRSFHVLCARLMPECRWDSDNFVMLCPLHASCKLPCEETSPKQRRCKTTPKGQQHSECNQAPQIMHLHGLSKKLVLCCSGLADEERNVISEFSKLPGVVVLRKWESSVTHVIASRNEKGACKRTLKVLMGILEGKWILSVDWVRACMKDMKCVDEEQYEITMDVHGIQNGPCNGRHRAMNKEPKIFEGLKFYVMGDFDPSYKGYLHDLVVAAGGGILRRRPVSGQAINCSSESLTFIVYYSLESPNDDDSKKENLRQRQSNAEALAKSVGARAVSSSWIMDSIAACKFQPGESLCN